MIDGGRNEKYDRKEDDKELGSGRICTVEVEGIKDSRKCGKYVVKEAWGKSAIRTEFV